MKKHSLLCLLALVFCFAANAFAVAPVNYKSGISVAWGGTEGVDWKEEYFYHDKLISDFRVVYLKAATTISFSHNALNVVTYPSTAGGRTIIGADGLDGIPANGDEGVIRYKIDRDRQVLYKWTNNSSGTEANVLPAYSAPFTLASQTYADSGLPVVGTTGSNGGDVTSKTAYYYRGILDSFGDEWHVLSFADDDRSYLATLGYAGAVSDGKVLLLVVNPKTPCLTLTPSGAGQFYTTPPKAYFTPKIVPQTTYFTGTVSFELEDINGNNLFYRINGGSWVDVGADLVTLDQDDFSSGSNTLEYYYAGNAAYTKTRIVVKNPTHPSLVETHGNYLWGGTGGLAAVQARVTRAPYKSAYDGWKTRGDFSGQADYDNYGHQGLRINAKPTDYLQGDNPALVNAIVAAVEGWSFTRSGASMSHGAYAVRMTEENSRTIPNLGFELSHSSDAIPSNELHYRGYYDAKPVLRTLFAYDIIAGNFRSDQVAGGMTPIEDYFIRDTLAGFAFEAMQWGAKMTGISAPGMWGGARMMTAASIATFMKEYSTAYYGTSGFGTVQTTYPLCPYQNDQLTWKQALFDGTAPKTNYPNLTYYTGVSDNDTGLTSSPASLFFPANQQYNGVTWPLGQWGDKAAYFSLMIEQMMTWANMMKIWNGFTDPRMYIGYQNAVNGTLTGAKDPYPLTGTRYSIIGMLNQNWPELAAINGPWVRSLPSSDSNSDDKGINPITLALYDDTYTGGADVTAPTPNAMTFEISPVALDVTAISFRASVASDAAPAAEPYKARVVKVSDSSVVYDGAYQASRDFTVSGLQASTQYTVYVRARDAAGNETAYSLGAPVTTGTPDLRTHRGSRGRAQPHGL